MSGGGFEPRTKGEAREQDAAEEMAASLPSGPHRRVWVTHSFVGFHRWPDAPAHRAYLAQVHRHVFHVRVEVEVRHNDREVEFHDLLDAVKEWCAGEQLGPASCEGIAEWLGEKVRQAWNADPPRAVTVSVSEDGENGAQLSWR